MLSLREIAYLLNIFKPTQGSIFGVRCKIGESSVQLFKNEMWYWGIGAEIHRNFIRYWFTKKCFRLLSFLCFKCINRGNWEEFQMTLAIESVKNQVFQMPQLRQMQFYLLWKLNSSDKYSCNRIRNFSIWHPFSRETFWGRRKEGWIRADNELSFKKCVTQESAWECLKKKTKEDRLFE